MAAGVEHDLPASVIYGFTVVVDPSLKLKGDELQGQYPGSSPDPSG